MAKRIGKNTVKFENNPSIKSYASVCGKKESEGPLGNQFDKIFKDTTLKEDSWEKAESKLQAIAVNTALEKAMLNTQDINYIFAGDLLNQCMSSAFGLRELGMPFLGQFGACSTMAQTLFLAATSIEAGISNYSVAVTSSHYCSSERQFRFPLNYGGQRTPTAQWTVTGSGAIIVERNEENPQIKHATVGKIVDLGIKDANNMGAAMAPAAAKTLISFFEDTNTKPDDYDMIFSGDLGEVGSDLLKELMKKENLVLGKNYNDCGLMMYFKETQDVHAGGSGCGCSASILCSYILNHVKNKEWKNILFMATGALMSPTSSQQGETIPGVAHLINITSGD